jgi:hypothetical protein
LPPLQDFYIFPASKVLKEAWEDNIIFDLRIHVSVAHNHAVLVSLEPRNEALVGLTLEVGGLEVVLARLEIGTHGGFILKVHEDVNFALQLLL